MQKAKIVLLGTVAAVTYGVLHDQITARLCIEYFSLAHPRIFPVQSLTMLALCWGVASTFFVGAIFGLLLALVSQSEGASPVPFPRLVRGVVVLLMAMACGAALVGFAGFELARHGLIVPPDALAEIISPDRHAKFLAVWFVHITSYVVGFLGMGVWLYLLWRERGRPYVVTFTPRSNLGLARATVLALLIVFILYVHFLRG